MQISGIPTKIGTIWAATASAPYINTIPVPSQIGIQNGRASFTDGFPPNCFIPVNAGGAGPFGGDFNGILQLYSQWVQWQNAGAPAVYDSVFQAAVGGYPQGARVVSGGITYISTIDNNTNAPPGTGWSRTRTILTTNTTFYVSTTGNDSNSGTVGSPWLTLTGAWNNLQAGYEIGGNSVVVTVQIENGTYAETFVANGPIVGATGPQSVAFQGQTGTPDSVIISATANDTVQVTGGAQLTLLGAKLTNSGTPGPGFGNNISIPAFGPNVVTFGAIDFGACYGAHLYTGVGEIAADTTYPNTVSGDAAYLVYAQNSGAVVALEASTINFSGTISFSGVTIFAWNNSFVSLSNVTWGGTYSSVTGKKYNILQGGGVYTGGSGGDATIPGNSNGTVISPGWIDVA